MRKIIVVLSIRILVQQTCLLRMIDGLSIVRTKPEDVKALAADLEKNWDLYRWRDRNNPQYPDNPAGLHYSVQKLDGSFLFATGSNTPGGGYETASATELYRSDTLVGTLTVLDPGDLSDLKNRPKPEEMRALAEELERNWDRYRVRDKEEPQYPDNPARLEFCVWDQAGSFLFAKSREFFRYQKVMEIGLYQSGARVGTLEIFDPSRPEPAVMENLAEELEKNWDTYGAGNRENSSSPPPGLEYYGDLEYFVCKPDGTLLFTSAWGARRYQAVSETDLYRNGERAGSLTVYDSGDYKIDSSRRRLKRQSLRLLCMTFLGIAAVFLELKIRDKKSLEG